MLRSVRNGVKDMTRYTIAGNLHPLSDTDQRRLLAAVVRSRHMLKEMLAARGGKLFPSSDELISDLREERARELSGDGTIANGHLSDSQ